MFVWSSFVAIDVFLKSFIIVSTHRQRHIASETGFKQDSPNPNPNSGSLIECSFFTEFRLGFTMHPNTDSLIEYPLRGSGISWIICKSATHSRPAHHYSVFTGEMPFVPLNQQYQNKCCNSVMVAQIWAKLTSFVREYSCNICYEFYYNNWDGSTDTAVWTLNFNFSSEHAVAHWIFTNKEPNKTKSKQWSTISWKFEQKTPKLNTKFHLVRTNNNNTFV